MRNFVKILLTVTVLSGASMQAMDTRALVGDVAAGGSDERLVIDAATRTDDMASEKDWYAPVPESTITSIDQIPEFCVGLLRRLEKQPWHEGAGCALSAKVKFLPLADWDESCICEIMAQNAANILGREKKWRVDSGDIIRRSGRWLGGGLLRIYYDDETPCSIEELQAVYPQIIQEIKSGWVQTTLYEHPDIYYKESEKDWLLFYKKEAHLQETSFINHFARKLCMSFWVACFSDWTDTRFVGGRRDDVYIWVRKGAPEELKKIFGLEITRS